MVKKILTSVISAFIVIIVSTSSLLVTNTNAATIIDDDFEAYTSLLGDMLDGTNIWQQRGYLQSGEAALETSGCRSGNCISVTYPSGGGSCDSLAVDLSSRVMHLRMSFKFTGGDWHTKFIKAFDGGSGDYANATCNNGYSGRSLVAVGGGDGEPGANDSEAVYGFTTALGDYGTGTITESKLANFTPTKGTWHTYEVYLLRNTDGNSDGIIRVWIDAVDEDDLYLEVMNWKMRPDAAPINWSMVRISEYSLGTDSEIVDWIDDVKITDELTYIGPVDTTSPVLSCQANDTSSSTSYSSTGTTYTLEGARTVSSCTWAGDVSGSGSCTAVGGNITASLTGLSEGANVITYTLTDSAAEVGECNFTVTVTLPSTIPVVDAGTDQGVSVDSVVISGTYTLDGIRTVSSCTYSIDTGGSGTLTAAGGTITGTVTGLLSGANVITITIVDSSAESGDDSMTATYTIPPAPGDGIMVIDPTGLLRVSDPTATPVLTGP